MEILETKDYDKFILMEFNGKTDGKLYPEKTAGG